MQFKEFEFQGLVAMVYEPLLFIQNIFPFLIVETTRIIHDNQLLFTKFGKKLRHIKSMTSKVQPALQIIEPMTSKVQPAADY